MSRNLTPWFAGGVKPVHVGVYTTRLSGDGWSYWRGDGWGPQMPTKIGAVQQRFVCGAAWKQWRGMTPNVRVEAGPAAKCQARTVENAPAHFAGLAF